MIRARRLVALLLVAVPLAAGCGDDSTPTKPKPFVEPPDGVGLLPGVLVGTGTLTGDVFALAVGDLNGDSLADVAVAGENRQIWVGLGSTAGLESGTVVDAKVQAGALAIADLDHDGINDLVAAGQGAVTLLRGSRGGISSAAETLTTIADSLLVARIRAGDLTNDDYPELVLTTYWRDATYLEVPHYIGTVITLAGATSIGPLPAPAELGDVNGDGALDLILSSFNFISSGIQVRLGANNGTFGGLRGIRSTGVTSRVLASDLDGDGADEVVCEHPIGTPGIGVMEWSGSSLGAESPVTGAPNGSVCVAADLNADRRPDLAMSSYLDTSVRVLYGNGTRGYLVGASFPAGDEVAEMGAGDVDGNGLVDVVTRGTGAGTVRFIPNDHLIIANAMSTQPRSRAVR